MSPKDFGASPLPHSEIFEKWPEGIPSQDQPAKEVTLRGIDADYFQRGTGYSRTEGEEKNYISGLQHPPQSESAFPFEIFPKTIHKLSAQRSPLRFLGCRISKVTTDLLETLFSLIIALQTLGFFERGFKRIEGQLLIPE